MVDSQYWTVMLARLFFALQDAKGQGKLGLSM